MFKKTIFVLLMAGFVGSTLCFMGCSEKKEAKKEAKKKDTFDLSSKEATVKTFIKAVQDGNIEQMWNCFSPGTQKLLEAGAKAEKKSLADFKQEMAKQLKAEVEKEIKEKGIDAMVAEGVKEGTFVQIDGNWYMDLADTAAEDNDKE